VSPPELDAEALLHRLGEAGVDYVVIDGLAVILHGYVRVERAQVGVEGQDLRPCWSTPPAHPAGDPSERERLRWPLRVSRYESPPSKTCSR
jgi:hypothetical protein